MDRYAARINANGLTQRDRYVNRTIVYINRKAAANPSYKLNTKLNGKDTNLVIDDGTSDSNKKVTALPGQVMRLGDYVDWDGKIYLVTSLDPDNELYFTGTMTLCNYRIHWRKSNGEIISRWTVVADYTKYDTGTTSNGMLEMASNQYGLTLPLDDETKILSRNHRFVLDILTDKDYENGVVPDVYRLTNRKMLLNNNTYFDQGGIVTLTMAMNVFNAETDHYIDLGNGEYGWVCGMAKDADINKPDPETEILYSISGDEFAYAGFEYTWTAMFENKDKTPASVIGWEWNVVADFDAPYDVQGNDIIMTVGKEHVGETVTLQVLYNGDVMVEKKIPIKGLC